jgi:hypothetical protein
LAIRTALERGNTLTPTAAPDSPDPGSTPRPLQRRGGGLITSGSLSWEKKRTGLITS